MEENQIVQLITNLGFPITVTFYLLLRQEKKMEKLTVAIQDLNKIILKCTK